MATGTWTTRILWGVVAVLALALLWRAAPQAQVAWLMLTRSGGTPFPNSTDGWQFVRAENGSRDLGDFDAILHIQFLTAEKVYGHDGCNSFCLTRASRAQTLVGCGDKLITDLEGNVIETITWREPTRDLIELMQLSHDYEFDGDTLEISALDLTMIFERAPTFDEVDPEAGLCAGLD